MHISDGIISNDKLQFHKKKNGSKFDFILSDSCSSDYRMNGMLGLGINSTDLELQTIGQLKKNGVIDHAIVGLYLNSIGVDKYNGEEKTGFGEPASNIIVGGYDLNYTLDPSSLIFIDLIPNPLNWTVTVNGISVENYSPYTESRNLSITMSEEIMLIDMETFTYLTNTLMDNYDCHNSTYFYDFYCNFDNETDLPNINMDFQGTVFTLPSDLIWTQWYPDFSSKLLIRPYTSDQKNWIFGLYFLRNYYTILDFENSRIGLSRSIPSTYDFSILFRNIGILFLAYFY